MAKVRAYQLLCPIARALDHLGDRWALLILRDLHAGPARFTDIEAGLPGIASNLLTTRLRELEADGFVVRAETEHGVAVYELTDSGRETQALMFELARIGSSFSLPKDFRKPAHLRSLAPGLLGVLKAATAPVPEGRIELRINEQPFEIEFRAGKPSVRYRKVESPDVVLSTNYEAILNTLSGELDLDEFMNDHVIPISGDPEIAMAFAETFSSGILNSSPSI